MASASRESTRDEIRRRNGVARRLVRLPLDIIEGVTRAMGHRSGLVNLGSSRHHHHGLPPPSPSPPPPPQQQQPWGPHLFSREGDYYFLHTFEQQYGDVHPFFYACPFAEALRLAEAESKFVFVYLHDPAHPYTAPFCRGTLCSELATQYLDANFVSWGAAAGVGEGPRVAQALRPPGFPFCAVVARASGGSFAVLQQVEGPVSPSELVEILQRATEEQGSAFRSPRTQEEVARIIAADRRLREEQDAAYLASLQIDEEKERVRELPIENADPLQSSTAWKKERRSPATAAPPGGRARACGLWGARKESTVTDRNPQQSCQIMIRFPNGERREQSFLVTDRIRSIYRFIDSLDMPGLGSYRLISNFPRRVYGYEQLDMTLGGAGLHQRATVFLELLQ